MRIKSVAVALALSMTSLAGFAESFECPEGAKKVGARPPEDIELKCLNSSGQLHGPYLRWYPGGQLMQSSHYKNGRQHGKQQAWWPNGKLMLQGTSVDGKRYDDFEYWDINGRPKRIGVKKIHETARDPAS